MNILRAQREWLEAHPGVALDEKAPARDPVLAIESYGSVKPELERLLVEHLREIDPHLASYEIAMSDAIYGSLDRAGILSVVTARDDGALVGYLLLAFLPHPHYKWVTFGSVTLVYVAKAWRGSGVYGRMLDRALDLGKDCGVELFACGARHSHAGDRALVRRGFVPFETTYLRVNHVA